MLTWLASQRVRTLHTTTALAREYDLLATRGGMASGTMHSRIAVPMTERAQLPMLEGVGVSVGQA